MDVENTQNLCKDSNDILVEFQKKIKEITSLAEQIPTASKSAAKKILTDNYPSVLNLLQNLTNPEYEENNFQNNSSETTVDTTKNVNLLSQNIPCKTLRRGKRKRKQPQKNKSGKTNSDINKPAQTEKLVNSFNIIEPKVVTGLSDVVPEVETEKQELITECVNMETDDDKAIDQHVNAAMVGECIESEDLAYQDTSEDHDALMKELDYLKPKSNLPFVKEGTPEVDDMSDMSSLLSFLPQLSPYIKFDMRDCNMPDKDSFIHLTVERADGSLQNLKIGGVSAASPEEISHLENKQISVESRAEKQMNLIEEQLEHVQKENDPFLDDTEQEEEKSASDEEISEEEDNKETVSKKDSRGRPRKKSLFKPLENGSGQMMYTCNVCAAKVQTSHALIVHMRIHSGDKPFKCTRCSKGFTTKGNLKQHEATHTDARPWNCEHCNKSFKEKKILQVHLRTHNGVKPFKCEICERLFTQSGVLKEHLLTHTGEKPHLCDFCGQGFRGLSSLRLHRLRHLNKRDFKCDKCHKDFISKHDLKRHYMTHTGARPFMCNVCPKRFTRINYLKEHLNIHDGTKPFKCPECHFIFSDSMSLHRHKKKHKAEKESQNKPIFQSELEKELMSSATCIQPDVEESLPTIEITEQNQFGEQTSFQVVLNKNTSREEFQRFHSLVLSAANSADFTLSAADATKQLLQVMNFDPDTHEVADQGQGHELTLEGQSSTDFSAITLLANTTAQQYNS